MAQARDRIVLFLCLILCPGVLLHAQEQRAQGPLGRLRFPPSGQSFSYPDASVDRDQFESWYKAHHVGELKYHGQTRAKVIISPYCGKVPASHQNECLESIGNSIKNALVSRGFYPDQFTVQALRRPLAAEKGDNFVLLTQPRQRAPQRLNPDFALAFKEGLAAFPHDGKFGYIDQTGKFVIPAQYDAASRFVRGIASVSINGKWGLINKAGETVLAPRYESLHMGDGELIAFRSAKHEQFGFVDRTGKVIIQPQYDATAGFMDGSAVVVVDSKHGIIDKTGKYTIEPQFEFLEARASEGLRLAKKDGRYGFIDSSGTFIIEPRFVRAISFSEGLAAASDGRVIGFIDRTGKYTITPQFQEVHAFSDGFALARLGGKWGFIDHNGVFLVQPIYEEAFPFSEGLAGVKERGRWGCIDRTGKFAIQPKFEKLGSFSGGFAFAIAGDQAGFIDKTGSPIIPSADEP